MRDIILDLLNNEEYKPLDERELLEMANIENSKAGEFLSELDRLESEGHVYKTKKNRYVLPEKVGLVAGKMVRTKKNFGFVIPLRDDNKKGDIFIPAAVMMGAMNGDTVMVVITADSIRSGGAGSREGEVKKILARGAYKFAGIFEGSRKFGFVTDTGCGEDFFISKEHMGKAKDGDRVVIKVVSWPEKGRKAEGRIVKVLGDANDSEALLQSLVFQHGLHQEFPDKVLKEAEEISDKITEDDLVGRTDLRHKVIVTIDGATAKDLDDAVSVEKLDNGNYLLGVHIADVAQYVKRGSKIDREAYNRGTSVYFIDRVIPMLPEKLSNGVCSLNPHIPRLTLTCEMEINSAGDVVSHSVFESVIQTTERLVYTDISDILENDDEVQKKRYEHILPEIYLMNELASILRKKRMDAGSIDFDLEEAYISVDENGRVVNIGIAERRVANRIIEEFMLKANETVSEQFFWLDIPFMYRVHEKPEAEKIAALKDFLWNLGYSLKGSPETIHPKALNDIIEQVKGDSQEQVVNTVVLRAMSKARYSESPDGHFGLGFKYYSHFTSPIRRYPDLVIHRIIKEYVTGRWNDDTERFFRRFVPEAARTSSEREIVAERMERDAEKLKIAEYMSEHVGEEYDGIISGVLSSGFFVEIGSMIEGFVRISTLMDDYYVLDKNTYRFIGERTGRQYKLGDSVRIVVSEADPVKREVNFEIVKDGKKPSGIWKKKNDGPQSKSFNAGKGKGRKGKERHPGRTEKGKRKPGSKVKKHR